MPGTWQRVGGPQYFRGKWTHRRSRWAAYSRSAAPTGRWKGLLVVSLSQQQSWRERPREQSEPTPTRWRRPAANTSSRVCVAALRRNGRNRRNKKHQQEPPLLLWTRWRGASMRRTAPQARHKLVRPTAPQSCCRRQARALRASRFKSNHAKSRAPCRRPRAADSPTSTYSKQWSSKTFK